VLAALSRLCLSMALFCGSRCDAAVMSVAAAREAVSVTDWHGMGVVSRMDPMGGAAGPKGVNTGSGMRKVGPTSEDPVALKRAFSRSPRKRDVGLAMVGRYCAMSRSVEMWRRTLPRYWQRWRVR